MIIRYGRWNSDQDTKCDIILLDNIYGSLGREKMLTRLICTLLYTLLLGTTWSLCFKKDFSESLATAFMTHILIVLISGMAMGKLSYGIYGGIIFAFIVLVYSILRDIKANNILKTLEILKNSWSGMLLYMVFFVFCFFSNHGKHFLYYDECSHWGMFLKESLRLDALYCTSPLGFVHKDYVPAITLFETIWCRLNGRFAETDAYRAIQIFMFSLLMPMFRRFKTHKNKLGQIIPVIFVLLIPLIFDTSDGFLFYHSIYCDLVVGIIFFWCAFEIFKGDTSSKYRVFVLTIGIAVLVMTKMSAMALLPLLIGLILMILFAEKDYNSKHISYIIPIMLVPIAIWSWFNQFVDKYIPNTGGTQSYDGLSLSSLSDVFTSPQNSSISYLGDLQKIYFNALINRNILIHGSYIPVLILITIGFFILAIQNKKPTFKRKAIISGIWVFACGIFNAVLMYFLYATSFDAYESLGLASFERYMNSMIISLLMLLIAVYYDSGIWEAHIKGFYAVTLIFFLYLAIFHGTAFDQVKPGNFTHDYEQIVWSLHRADIITGSSEDNDRIYAIYRGDGTSFVNHMRYYCHPRTVDGGCIGPAIEGEAHSDDFSIQELLNILKNYDYIYFAEIDDVFIQKYSGAFETPELLETGKIYRIIDIDDKISME